MHFLSDLFQLWGTPQFFFHNAAVTKKTSSSRQGNRFWLGFLARVLMEVTQV
jgi:hypothetical protein